MEITQTFQNELLLSEEDRKQGFWIQDDVHLSHALTPLFASFMAPAVSEGTQRAFDNLKLPLTQFRFKLADGRIYQQNVPFPGNPEQRLKEHQEAISSLLPVQKDRLFGFVENEFLPFYRKLDEYRNSTSTLEEARERVMELFDFYRRAWQLHFEIVMPRGGFMALEQMYGQLTGETETTVVYDLLSGVMNKSLETDRELWKLADLAKRDPQTRAALTVQPAESGYIKRLEATEPGRELLRHLRLVLEEYGHRSANSHEFADETWVENPEHALRIIASYIRKDYDFDEQFARIVKEREARAAELFAKLPEGELKRNFATMYQWALDSWGLDEDHHFYIDAMLPAKSRPFLLRTGELLVENGVLADRQDIFHFYLDELLDVLSAPSAQHGKVEQRKIEHEANKRKKAAPFYGEPPKQQSLDPALERVFGGKPPEIREQEQTFTGYAASQGVYTGTVKVVLGPEDFGKVEHGDILVCKTTTPPWTALFSIVGAIVTDTGGILSHAGTVAREYKLPAVVGSKVATSVLKDGDRVTVDGSKGVVHFGQV
ncbi:PEP-utilizing enzyme [Paenibacillus allorhizosphaerae]|uniref:Chondramide synthase cmdD n=1 Tax=Paenibacillus allorhizosphaerae TaxID=2849866 RepID=A0ABM8VGA5_9BACL|nr:PEP-utilizing enzyme [Paenibacillus allorhizosphaerae]CAG7637831.1 Chondramide synthase cmdD [Paenibacillus allorhizosphaerae]